MYYIRCKSLQLLLNGQKVGDENDATLNYDIPTTEDRAQIQQIAHWSAPFADASFVTETVVREGIYPTTVQMKKAAEQREKEALEKMAVMLADGLTIGKQPDAVVSVPESKSQITKNDENLDLPD